MGFKQNSSKVNASNEQKNNSKSLFWIHSPCITTQDPITASLSDLTQLLTVQRADGKITKVFPTLLMSSVNYDVLLSTRVQLFMKVIVPQPGHEVWIRHFLEQIN